MKNIFRKYSKLYLLLQILLLIFFDISKSFSGVFTRSTSFDNRTICEEQQGIWRIFGNVCLNNCESAVDQFAICSNSVSYGCDCGKGKCWTDDECVNISDFKKKLEDLKKENDEKEKRKDVFKENEQDLMYKLIDKKIGSINSSEENYDKDKPESYQNMSGSNYKSFIDGKIGKIEKKNSDNKTQYNNNSLIPEQPNYPIQNQNNSNINQGITNINQDISINPSYNTNQNLNPPLFLEQENSKKPQEINKQENIDKNYEQGPQLVPID